jgi:hypothetical protein
MVKWARWLATGFVVVRTTDLRPLPEPSPAKRVDEVNKRQGTQSLHAPGSTAMSHSGPLTSTAGHRRPALGQAGSGRRPALLYPGAALRHRPGRGHHRPRSGLSSRARRASALGPAYRDLPGSSAASSGKDQFTPSFSNARSMRLTRAGTKASRCPAATAASATSAGVATGFMLASTGSRLAESASANAARTVSSGTASPAANASSARSWGRRPRRAFLASQTTSSQAPPGGADTLPRPRPSARRYSVQAVSPLSTVLADG